MHWTPPLVDVVDQLEALAALFARGLLSDEDVDRQKRRILGPRRHGAR
ncbi:MAG: SHOCT domain-containing protein [Ilumatobacteraceae bacterium]